MAGCVARLVGLTGAVGLVLLLVVGHAQERRAGKWHVVQVLDGDTLVISRGPLREVVRLAGIDAPAYAQPYGWQAAEELDAAARGAVAIQDVEERDAWGRLVCDLSRWDGCSVSALMLGAGLAWCEPSLAADHPFREVEAEARRQRLGLWSQPGAVPPWEWLRPPAEDDGGGLCFDPFRAHESLRRW